MAKKIGKFFMATAALGAIAAGTYYFLQKKDASSVCDFDDEDDFDEFDEDLDDEDADSKTEADRKYVDLDLAKAADAAEEKAEEFKEGLDATKADAEDKIVGAVEDTAKAVSNAETKVEEFFDDEDKSKETN